MTVLFFICSLVGGGAERVTLNLAEELVGKGYRVIIVLLHDVIQYDVDSRIIIEKIEEQNSDTKGYLQTLLSKLENFFYYYKAHKLYVEKYRPNIIVSSYGSRLDYILLTHKRIPIIVSEHNTYDRVHTRREKISRFLLNRFVEKVVVLTDYDNRIASKTLNNVITIPNPLTFTPLDETEYIRDFSKRRNVLACGRVNSYKVKGFDNLIKAFALVKDRYEDWNLDIAGNYTKESLDELMVLVKEYKMENRVKFLGFCKEIDNLMKQYSIFVLPSRSEGFGMVLAEAMAMGCSCVSFALSGPKEIIKNGVDGILVENQNITELAKELDSIMSSQDRRKMMGLEAIKNVRRFSSEIVTNKWIELFQAVGAVNFSQN